MAREFCGRIPGGEHAATGQPSTRAVARRQITPLSVVLTLHPSDGSDKGEAFVRPLGPNTMSANSELSGHDEGYYTLFQFCIRLVTLRVNRLKLKLNWPDDARELVRIGSEGKAVVLAAAKGERGGESRACALRDEAKSVIDRHLIAFSQSVREEYFGILARSGQHSTHDPRRGA